MQNLRLRVRAGIGSAFGGTRQMDCGIKDTNPRYAKGLEEHA